MRVVAMWLVRHTLRRAEVDAARHGPTGGIIHHDRLDPVAAVLHDPHANHIGLDGTAEHVTPPNRLDGFFAELDRDGRGGDCRNLGVRGTARRVLGLTPAGESIVQKLIRCAPRELIRVARNAAVDVDLQVRRTGGERKVGQRWVLQIDSNRHHGITREGLFVGESERDRCHQEALSARDDLE